MSVKCIEYDIRGVSMTNQKLEDQEVQALKARLNDLQAQLEDVARMGKRNEHTELYHAVEDIVELIVDGRDDEVEVERVSQLRSRLERYAAEFDAEHPRTSAVLRQIGATLERMGI